MEDITKQEIGLAEDLIFTANMTKLKLHPGVIKNQHSLICHSIKFQEKEEETNRRKRADNIDESTRRTFTETRTLAHNRGIRRRLLRHSTAQRSYEKPADMADGDDRVDYIVFFFFIKPEKVSKASQVYP